VLKNPDYVKAREALLAAVRPVDTERVSLWDCSGRVLAADVLALENIPPFDRSPYDGYAFRAADTAGASGEHPVTLRILEELPAGAVSHVGVTEGTAVKILTGAPIPHGADTVVPYEQTEFTKEQVTLFSPTECGRNVVRVGEDVQKGALLARAGSVIDAGLAGVLASQGMTELMVYRKPWIGILSTGRELAEADDICGEGKIRDSNRFMLKSLLESMGFRCISLGIADDSAEELRAALERGLAMCDAVVSTGGVSVGDYDLMPEAMERAGATPLLRGVAMKPGMACAYAVRNGKLICGLSGNPASAFTNFHAVAAPALRKLAGRRECLPREIRIRLTDGFGKSSSVARFLRGTLELRDGVAAMSVRREQGNAVLSSTIGCEVMAVIPERSGPVAAGTELEGFLI